MAIKAKRTVVSELQKKVATLSVAGWDLTFNYENETGQSVTAVTVSGSKDGAYISYSLSGNQTNINFSNTPYNQDIIAAIQIEVDDITAVAVIV